MPVFSIKRKYNYQRIGNRKIFENRRRKRSTSKVVGRGSITFEKYERYN
jgi:hypothetical protein